MQQVGLERFFVNDGCVLEKDSEQRLKWIRKIFVIFKAYIF